MKLISRDELRDKLDGNENFKLIMTLSARHYRAKHIPASLHFENIDEALTTLDPTEEIVVYCADVHCPASVYAYRLFERAGFTRVRRYAGGIADWEQAGLPLTRGRIDANTDRQHEDKVRISCIA